MTTASALGISRERLAGWAAECGFMLVPKPDLPDFYDVAAARIDDCPDGTMKVYFVRESGTGAIKIGMSKQLSKRLSELARILPYAIDLLATIDGGREVEWALHNRFDHARIQREWFRPVPELLAYIDEIKR
jgi:hypothetical protein